jgi:nicotinate-nucleotide pyrophosphorylase (carboxylating)
VRRARSADDSGLTIEVEVTDLEGVAAALEAGADRILLDNMPVEAVRRAVKLVRRQAPDVAVEASGGVTLETVGELAKAGVDYISVGALTHSAPALDMSLRLRTVTR